MDKSNFQKYYSPKLRSCKIISLWIRKIYKFNFNKNQLSETVSHVTQPIHNFV